MENVTTTSSAPKDVFCLMIIFNNLEAMYIQDLLDTELYFVLYNKKGAVIDGGQWDTSASDTGCNNCLAEAITELMDEYGFSESDISSILYNDDVDDIMEKIEAIECNMIKYTGAIVNVAMEVRYRTNELKAKLGYNDDVI